MIDASDVTVIVPAYNVAEYLEECLGSIVDHGGRAAQIIVIDDGSTDGTREVALTCQRANANITVEATVNGGQSAARNLGLRMARTGFVTFVDADDMIAPDGLSMLFAAAEPDIDITFSNRHRFDNYHRAQPRLAYRNLSRVSPAALPLPGILAIHGKLFRRAFLVEHDFFFPEGMVYEDVPFSLSTMLKAERVSSIAAVTYLWRTRAGPNRSTTQMRIARRTLEGRMRQIEMTLEIERSAAWQERFGPTKLHKLVFDRYMLSHVEAMQRAKDEAAIRRAFDLIRPFVLAHRSLIEATVSAEKRAGYDAIFAGNVNAFLTNIPAPRPARSPARSSRPTAQVSAVKSVAVKRAHAGVGALRWKISAAAAAALAILSEFTEGFAVSDLVAAAF
ncbi:glycosyltransferase family 2 protein [Sphingomonas sp. ID0503]|uniref:glycosyltransferase family 2 protein n=1 Tax=Sphingomonas sp. ID0503 TaxID=3399691 RepID=UPI003AFB44A6